MVDIPAIGGMSLACQRIVSNQPGRSGDDEMF